MKIVLSPAKSLDTTTSLPTVRNTQPRFLDKSLTLNKLLARLSPKDLSGLMGISEKLADLNYQRNQDFEERHIPHNSRPAMYLFSGDVYVGLDAYSIPVEKLRETQDSLRILSGLYGVLRPLDLTQPYRLEMGTKLPVEKNKNLYEFWKKTVTESLNKELADGELFVNLASKEYAKVIDTKQLKVSVISPVFKDFKNGKLKIISFHAKKARGAMARHLINHEVETLEGIKKFRWEGYQYSENHSEEENAPVFIR